MTENYFDMIYIGYYLHPDQDMILLCVSDELFKVEYYLQEIRGLRKKEIEIKKVALDWDTTISLYEDHILESYIEPYNYLTRKDILGLDREIEQTMDHWTEIVGELKLYRDFVSGIPRFYEAESPLIMAIRTMESHLSNVKNLRRLSKEIIKKSPITSRNIFTYLNAMEIICEDLDLTLQFYQALDQDE